MRGVFESLAPEYFVYTVLHHFSRRTTFGKMVSRRIRTYFPEIWKSWKSGNSGSNKSKKMKILKIKIHSAQNVGKVWISRKKTFPAPFGATPGHFLRGPEKCKKGQHFAFFAWALLLSTLGGVLGMSVQNFGSG